ncbi:DegT/DnrJ/EryC1/StrS family aminotransferase [Streptomyces sp. TRM 70351]|uniref:DegT/DnrJ/EryC1/StrS family aminotransferase n=1 Tax=Streptomyces sp. TRM 70351 TaxID=3116552 RepID=UPI002E7C0D65|nr:DegT/DnrJ/EryC1/StrS family aminotransferase [Streptomyces sp. TRM 70351]MEE1926578.1 DegT/DnrJ/EryC1/StrS family aminotransferase [Streptomyces sp. TRM 70351]
MLAAAGVRAGDEVVLPSFGGEETARAVRSLDAVPVFADIDAASLCLDPDAAEAAVGERTAAVVPLALFGHPVDTSRFLALGERCGVRIVMPQERDPGVPELDAARRRQHAVYLDARLTGVVTPTAAPGVRHAYTQYVVRVPGNGRPDRDAFRRALSARGVRCTVPVPTPAHRTTAHRGPVRLPETERAAAETLALPFHAGLTRRELHRIVGACNALGGLVLEPAG